MKLPLQLEDLNSADSEEYEVSQGGIIFSPGGSQAYMFTQASPEDEEASKLTEDQVKPHLPPQSLPSRSKEPPTQPLSQTPREIRDPIFLERHSEDRAILPHGERPKTVGQSADGPTRNRTQQQQQVVQLPPLPNLQTSPPLVAPLPTASKQMTSLKGRLEDLKYSLDQSGVGVGGHPPPDLPSTAESSPRMFPRFSPSRLPMARDQFLNDPDSFNLNLNATETEMTTDDAESLPSPHPGGLPLTDRATSPSVASVVSMASSTASGQTTGRRGLEWDSGADLGYLGGEFAPQNQKDAAASLSTLEKLAIGNYSSYLRTEPEGKPSKAAAAAALAAAGGGATSGRNSNLRQYRQNIEDEKLRQVRLHKFADSLMRQRELRAMASAAASANPAERSESRRRRSKSRESSRKSDSTPEGSPSHSRQKKKRNQYGAAPVKSASLTDLQGGSHDDLAEINFKLRRNFRSNSDVSSHHFLLHQNFRSPLYHSSEPSSCSSSTTVVPIHRSEAATQVEHANLLVRSICVFMVVIIYSVLVPTVSILTYFFFLRKSTLTHLRYQHICKKCSRAVCLLKIPPVR